MTQTLQLALSCGGAPEKSPMSLIGAQKLTTPCDDDRLLPVLRNLRIKIIIIIITRLQKLVYD